MKLTSILLKTTQVLLALSIISCSNETIDDLNLEDNETALDISQINSAKNHKLLKKFNNCFSIVTEVGVTDKLTPQNDINDDTGVAIDEIITEETTEDYTEITFPITILLNDGTTEVSITSLEELMTVIETCKTKKHDCNKDDDKQLSSSEVNAGILIKYKKCFEVIIEELPVVTGDETTSDKKIKSKNKKSNHNYSYSDLTFPIAIILNEETIEITTLEELKELLKTCKKRGCNDDEETETEVPVVITDPVIDQN